MRDENRIVVTGIGVLSPFGVGTEIFWNGLIQGNCAVRKVTQFPVDSDIYPCKIASEVPEFDPWPLIRGDDPALQGRYPKLALTALGMAIEDAGLSYETDALRSADLYMGAAQQTGDEMETFIGYWIKEKDFMLPNDILSRIDPCAVVTAASRIYGIGGRMINLTASCTSGALALMLCVERIRAKRSEIGIAVGTEAISPLIFMGAGLTGELAKRNDDPASASRPFDRDQDGYVLGEGAVALVVETESYALARGAHIYAELRSFAATTDATSFKYVDETGTQMARGMTMVLNQVPANQIDYINAHGPSIVALDTAESIAIRQAFGKFADQIPVTSIKGAIGNPSAAGGMLQVVSGILSIRDGIIPPTINLENPLPACDLDYVNAGSRKQKISTVFISTHGGGGLNAALTVNSSPH